MNISSPGNMQLKVSQEKNLATLHLGGSFEFADYREFQNSCLQILQKPAVNIIEINLNSIQQLDSAAMGMLLLLREHCRDAGKSIRLVNPSSFVRKVFDLTNFEAKFNA